MLVIELKSHNKSKPPLYSDLRKLKKDESSPVRLGENYYVHYIPRLPSWLKGKHYRYSNHKLDLHNLKCDCEAQGEKLEFYKARDVRAICKHLYYKLINSELIKELDSLTLLLMRSAVLWGEAHLYKYVYKGDVIVIGFKENSEWVNVYTKNDFDQFHRYSFNPSTNRWSYGKGARYSELLPDLIKRIIEYQLPFEHITIK